jgi:hypothetical protein
VIKWFDYLWSNKQSMDEQSVLEMLPDKLKVLYMHCKKRLVIFPSPAVMPGIINYSRPGRVWLVTSRGGTGNSISFFTV